MSKARNSVLVAPAIGSRAARRSHAIEGELTLAQIVEATLPGLPKEAWPEVHLTLVSDRGAAVIPSHLWHLVRPNEGVRVVIVVRPGLTALGSVLISVLTAQAASIGAAYLGTWAGLAGASQLVLGAISGLAYFAGQTAGNLLRNALFGNAGTSDDGERRNSYLISGWQNESRPGQRLPLIIGRQRYSPPFAANSYSEIVGDDMYVRALFTFGYGRVDISDLRLGDTPLSAYDVVEYEIREGTSADEPVTLYPRQVIEEALNVELTRPFPRADDGEILYSEGAQETPVVRYSASDAAELRVIFSFPSGLYVVDDSGNVGAFNAPYRIRQRPEGGSEWLLVTTIDLVAENRTQFFRQFTWSPPYRGRWEVEVTRMRQEETNTQVSDRCHWAALQTIRPEYPVNFPKPLSLVALRIKATAQLNGALDNFNALAQAYAPTWDGEDWVAEGLTRNPASAVLRILQSPANTYPVADAGLYLDELSEWFEWCAARDLKYDFVHESEMKLWEALQVICQAGRASPRHDGIRWGVILDRPDLPVIYHINPRNSDGMNWGRTYFNPPDGFRVSFRDETNDYEVAERIVPWPGFEGEVELTEALQLPGKTDPDEIYIEATRRALELEYRPDTITTVLDSQAHVVTRGDKVMGSFNRLVSTQAVARVKSVRGTLVELDEEVTMSAGVDYAIRFFSFASDEDAEGESVVVAVNARTGTTRAIALTSDAQMPREGDLVQFGVLGLESLALRVVSIEPGSNFSSVLRCVADAPEIDAAIDALVVPAWNGRVGAEVEIAAAAPGVPTITGIDHGTVGTGDPDGLRVLFAPSTGSVITASIRVEHKLSGDAEYSSLTVSAGSGAADIPGYSFGDEVDIRLVAIATDGTSESAATSVATIVIGAGDPALPDALDAGAILITGRLGFASISVPTGSDPSLSRLQIYRAPSGVALDRDVHSVGSPYGVTLSTTMTFIDGDATRSNLLPNSTFDDATGATLGTGWAVAGGVATHTAGSAGTLSQTVALTGGKTYRGALVVAGRTAGDLTPKLIGGTDQSATSISADGVAYFAIEAVAGNVEFGLTAGTDFDGNVDALVLFEVSANSIPQGTFDYYIEPQNSAGGAGPVAGPFETTVV